MKDLSKMTEQEKKAVLARREYMKQWRKKNPTKQKEYTERYFAKLAAADQKKAEEQKETVWPAATEQTENKAKTQETLKKPMHKCFSIS